MAKRKLMDLEEMVEEWASADRRRWRRLAAMAANDLPPSGVALLAGRISDRFGLDDVCRLADLIDEERTK